jgi:hypothetical protein
MWPCPVRWALEACVFDQRTRTRGAENYDTRSCRTVLFSFLFSEVNRNLAVWLGSKRKRTPRRFSPLFGGGDLERRHSKEGGVLLQCTPAGLVNRLLSRDWIHCAAKGTEVKLNHMSTCYGSALHAWRLVASGDCFKVPALSPSTQDSRKIPMSAERCHPQHKAWLFQLYYEFMIAKQLFIPQHKAVSRLVPCDSGLHYARTSYILQHTDRATGVFACYQNK